MAGGLAIIVPDLEGVLAGVLGRDPLNGETNEALGIALHNNAVSKGRRDALRALSRTKGLGGGGVRGRG